IIQLLPAEAAGAQCCVVEREERLRRERMAQPGEPAVHRGGGIDRDLLLKNDVQERREAVTPPAEARLTGAIEDGAKHRLAGERLDPLFQTLRRVDQAHKVSPKARAPAGRACCRHSAAPAFGRWPTAA